MKSILIFPLLFILKSSVIASDSAIVFKEIEHSKIFDLAKKEKKAIFLYFHFDGCGACVEMEKSAFVNKEVANFYNSNFVSLEINTLKGEGLETNKIYNVKLHPTFLFLDLHGNITHKIVGVFSPNEFIEHAQNALSSQKSLKSLKQQYKDGNRDSIFLFDFCYQLRDANELDSIHINQYLNTLSLNDLGKENNIKFIYEFTIHNHKIALDINNKSFLYFQKNKEKFYEFFEKDQVNSRIVWVLYSAIYKAIENENKTTFKKLNTLLKEYDTGQNHYFKEMDGRITGIIASKSLVLSTQMSFYEKLNQVSKFKKALKKYLKMIWDDSNALNEYAWSVYQHSKSSQYKLEKAIECIIKSIELNSNYANNDTYACLLFKLKKYDEALAQASKAIDIAKKNNTVAKETEDLIKKITLELEK